ncbi:addiction module component [Roseivirga pacifica]|uniref:addiction module component n=1 Tax=Roseivirga pacifica TaxID=1267423 RepID=UPI00227A11B5|nr:addiction module component [Roseivirga pacifica]
MDTQSIKLDLIQWLTELKDAEVLKQVQLIKENEDWWNQVSDQEKEAIDYGLKELEEGKGIPHNVVMEETRKKYGL